MTEDVNKAIEALLNSVSSVQLATLNAEGLPEISYTPYLYVDSDVSQPAFYIFISELAKHTQNLKVHAKLSLLVIQDEREAKNLFARQRIAFQCLAEPIKRDQSILDAFEHKHGNTVSLLRTLSDFLLFKVTVEAATFVQGFGQAFRLDPKSLTPIEHISGQ